MIKIRILILIILFVPAITNAQKFGCSYTVIDSPKLSKNELYLKAREWASKLFVKANEVIQMDDKEAGKIICTGLFAIDGAKNGFGMSFGDDYVYFNLTVDIKDNKYRLVVDRLTHKGGFYKNSVSGGDLCKDKPECGTFLLPMSRWSKYKKRADAECQDVIASFKKAIQTTDTF